MSRLAAAPCRRALLALTLEAALACSRGAAPPPTPTPAPPSAEAPAILLVTLDTTRGDSVGYANDGVETPNLDALAVQGLRFDAAYATAPMTLPSHTSMLSGRYPSEHGIHENARTVDGRLALLAPELEIEGYRTAAFVSGFPLARQFGLGRGFDRYDDELPPGLAERRAGDTTDRAVAFLAQPQNGPLFLWVHYFDAHEPYAPPEPFASRYAADPYLGEIAFVDQQLGRLLEAFAAAFPDAARRRVIVAGDHGEGRGDHGERLHGNLLYQGVMRVPLVIVGAGRTGVESQPVSLRRVHDTVLGWAQGDDRAGLLAETLESVVLGEAMQPYLQYGWQPQVMAVEGALKAIEAGGLEIYDLSSDAAESIDLAGTVELGEAMRKALGGYPLPSGLAVEGPGAADELDQATRERLAALGYVPSEGEPVLQADAPRPRDMAPLFADLDLASGRFVRGQYVEAIPVLERLARADPRNFTLHLRLGVAHSVLGHRREAERELDRAAALRPLSLDVLQYRALHDLRFGQQAAAEGALEKVLQRMPDRLAALEAMAQIRERQGRIAEAGELLEHVARLRPSPAPVWLHLGDLRMSVGDTDGAIAAFEQARGLLGESFREHLQLGVLYLAARRLEEARDELDRVPGDDPGRAMALFKRAQVSALLGEPDREERIRRAREEADDTTRPLIEREPLFRGATSGS